MADERRFADAGSLRPVARAAFGAGRRMLQAERLAGGSKKGAYRLTMDDGGTALAYVWDDAEDYWQGVLPDDADDPANPFSHPSGLAMFETVSRRMASAGVRCPSFCSPTGPGPCTRPTSRWWRTSPAAASRRCLRRIRWQRSDPWRCWPTGWPPWPGVRSPSFGRVALVDAGGGFPGLSGESAILGRALAQLTDIADRDQRAADAQGRLRETLRSLAAPIEPRADLSLVHGELGPDHILLDRRGEPVLIDIEGAMYSDAEAEHVWTRMRFGRRYAKLNRGGLDQDRLRLYQLCLHLDLVAGPLAIAGTSHPEREWFLEVAEHHLQRALQFPA